MYSKLQKNKCTDSVNQAQYRVCHISLAPFSTKHLVALSLKDTVIPYKSNWTFLHSTQGVNSMGKGTSRDTYVWDQARTSNKLGHSKPWCQDRSPNILGVQDSLTK